MVKLNFLGAAQTVTGSKYLLEVDNKKILIDCGLFQGLKELRLMNWAPFPFPVNDIDCVILTHAHIDHSGYIPLLARNGFKGSVYCTSATKDLCALLLPDAGYLQEEEANYLNKHKKSKHNPALPLYTEADAENCLKYFKDLPLQKVFSLGEGINFEFVSAGHLLGAASVKLNIHGKSIIFSGDIGRNQDPLLRDPQTGLSADILVLESTYGDRLHEEIDSEQVLCQIILETMQRGGTLLIPSFAVGRAQLLLYYIYKLKQKNLIPDIPVYLNSPMANKASDLLVKHSSELKLSDEEVVAVCNTAIPVRTVEESIALNNNKNEPLIIIAASGMATGGRVLHHLKELAPDPRNTILFAGFQAAGTRGEAMVKGVDKIKIHGEYWPIQAKVINLESLSAHADANELVNWVKSFKKLPKQIFLTHGEPLSAHALKDRIQKEFSIEAQLPKLGEAVRIV